MRGNNYARYTHSYKFDPYSRKIVEEGNDLRKRLEGKRILETNTSTTQMALAFNVATEVLGSVTLVRIA